MRDSQLQKCAEAVAFGEVVLLAVPWAAVGEALKAGGLFKSKVLFSCVNCLKPDFSGLAVATTSAAEEIARAAPDARVVEALPPMAEVLAELITGWPDSRSAHSTAATMRRRRRLLPACCATSTSNRSMPGR